MKILLVSATKTEVAPLVRKFRSTGSKGNPGRYRFGKHSIDVLITGVGMTVTAFSLGKTLNKNYSLSINAGIAGSFRKNIPVGSVVNVLTDRFADLGAENGAGFLTVQEMGLGGIKSRFAGIGIPGLKKVNGITVNTVHGNAASIRKVIRKFDPDVESMEGAAFFLACDHEKIPCIQIRAISNFVERRNRKKWKIDLAVSNLSGVIERFLYSLER